MADDAGRLNEVLAETSFLYGGNAGFVEDLHARWAADPNSVEPSWRAFFASLHDSADDVQRAPPSRRLDAGADRRAAARLALGHRRPVAGGGRQARAPGSPSGSRRPAADEVRAAHARFRCARS